ncbi:L-serine ammonia-lyase, iron-sulfur-dependent subunit beta [Anaerovorax odorimutans]|uniref:L-serine ammonia-lyase, iron-sulfur-dependent subunit beta n=1 Tax=Anaerovorax odorimutans TaxID=109327 RepID=UPI00040BC42D|nr:L-serine ammonia-lyase, iron-sulfur-dependent subunit beta [Anaerovorax odorimutans]
MNISIFQVAGPVMIGPSSSHTAGAVRLARTASRLVNYEFDYVTFGLHASFAETGTGHGTDKALVAGVLGLMEDDENIINAFYLADKRNLRYKFYKINLEGMHENSVKITFYKGDKQLGIVCGSSIGGGEITINQIDGYKTEIRDEYPTLFIRQRDKEGIISFITSILSEYKINIATMKVSRMKKKENAACVIELDEKIPEEIIYRLEQNRDIYSVNTINM